jgi:hypothetical protein
MVAAGGSRSQRWQVWLFSSQSCSRVSGIEKLDPLIDRHGINEQKRVGVD